MKKSATVSTLEGKQADVVIDVYWQRYFFNPTELKGSITFNEIEYVSMTSLYEVGTGEHFFERLLNKWRNERRTPTFVIPEKDFLEQYNDIVNVFYINDEFEIIYLAHHSENIHDEHADVYYGPAETTEEAQIVLNQIKEIWGIE